MLLRRPHGEAQSVSCTVANLGDTRAVVCEAGSALRLTQEHRPTNPDEVERVRNAGGSISKGRLAGSLAVTRALGDLELKDLVISL